MSFYLPGPPSLPGQCPLCAPVGCLPAGRRVNKDLGSAGGGRGLAQEEGTAWLLSGSAFPQGGVGLAAGWLWVSVPSDLRSWFEGNEEW